MPNPIEIDPEELPRHRFTYEMRRHRKLAGWSREQLAERVHMSPSKIGNVETTYRNLFQTEAYARRIFQGAPGITPEEAEERLRGRMRRQAILTRRDGPMILSLALVAVRDGKNPEGPVLVFTGDEWKTFIHGIKAGDTAQGA